MLNNYATSAFLWDMEPWQENMRCLNFTFSTIFFVNIMVIELSKYMLIRPNIAKLFERITNTTNYAELVIFSTNVDI